MFPIMIFPPPFCCNTILLFFSVLYNEMSWIYGSLSQCVTNFHTDTNNQYFMLSHILIYRKKIRKQTNHEINKLWLNQM